jgi:hypothetical protein
VEGDIKMIRGIKNRLNGRIDNFIRVDVNCRDKLEPRTGHGRDPLIENLNPAPDANCNVIKSHSAVKKDPKNHPHMEPDM